MKISFYEIDRAFPLKERTKIRAWIQSSIESFDRTIGEINFITCSDEYLLDMNIQFLGHDYYTDVITFDYGVDNMVSGDIYISLDRIKENALNFGVNYQFELLRIMIHGTLHLIGYKDHTKSKRKIMSEFEDVFLAKYNV